MERVVGGGLLQTPEIGLGAFEFRVGAHRLPERGNRVGLAALFFQHQCEPPLRGGERRRAPFEILR